MPDATLRRWLPVTKDFGLVEAPVDAAATAYVEWLGSAGVTRRQVGPTLERAFDALPPLSMQMCRALFLPTRSSWAGFFRSGISGSDPFLPMCGLAGQLNARSMRICVSDRPSWPACIWEMYEPNTAADAIHGARVRRVVAAASDGGRWTFVNHGAPFSFEEHQRYAMPRKRDRFDKALLARYLEHLGLRPFDDVFYDVSALNRGILLEENDRWPNMPEYSLDEVRSEVPWHKRQP